jgi:formylglycine-generating enzyme required for sulfatase activity
MRKTFKVAAWLGVVACFGASTARAEAPKKITETIPGTTVKFDLVQLPAGKVKVGDKEVEIKPVWIGTKEVTWDEYDVFWQRLDLKPDEIKAGVDAENRPSKPYSPPDRGFGHDGFPAGSMTFAEAQKYVKWLSKITKKNYRLPTEAEWEYAAKAGTDGTIEKGKLKEVAVYGKEQPEQTGQLKPNAWGLYDILGNVAEWVVRDDKTGVIAGGSFEDDAADVNYSARAEYTPAWQRDDPQDPKGKSWLSNGAHIGIRVVRED